VLGLVNIGLLTSRPLGWAISEIIKDTDDVKVVEHSHIADGWWGTAGQPLDYTTREEPDFYLSILWPHIIRPEALALHHYINLHPAPLPEYRGLNSCPHAIINGETEFGVTLHYMDSGIDTGPIIASPRFDILPDDTGRSLYDRTQVHALDMFEKQWPRIKTGVAPSVTQPSYGRYYDRHSLEPYFGSDDPTVRRALTFPPFTNGYERT
jgi:hypothetical protein